MTRTPPATGALTAKKGWIVRVRKITRTAKHKRKTNQPRKVRTITSRRRNNPQPTVGCFFEEMSLTCWRLFRERHWWSPPERRSQQACPACCARWHALQIERRARYPTGGATFRVRWPAASLSRLLRYGPLE